MTRQSIYGVSIHDYVRWSPERRRAYHEHGYDVGRVKPFFHKNLVRPVLSMLKPKDSSATQIQPLLCPFADWPPENENRSARSIVSMHRIKQILFSIRQSRGFKIAATRLGTNKVNHLLRLAPELRLMIFRDVLTPVHPSVHRVRPDAVPVRTAIMLTCRVFHNEAASILYGEYCLTIDGREKPETWPLRKPYRTLIRKLHIQIWQERHAACSERFEKMLKQLDLKLQYLKFSFCTDEWCDEAQRVGDEPFIDTIYQILSSFKQVELFEIWMRRPVFPLGYAENLRRAFLTGEESPGRRIRFLVPHEVLEWYEGGQMSYLEHTIPPPQEADYIETSDLAVCEKELARAVRCTMQ
ncbi:hypothetical protein EV356DRAFT_502100 [Viridothelium virens]|uniref:Uncharacterized protein n=1 Tax=Viridothelium virens TaxID=1048519 RepID=A0A6A6HM82_VIRVR|nr:hypothetical protein EV356DRAFT_502100 [Viridothelium virens]